MVWTLATMAALLLIPGLAVSPLLPKRRRDLAELLGISYGLSMAIYIALASAVYSYAGLKSAMILILIALSVLAVFLEILNGKIKVSDFRPSPNEIPALLLVLILGLLLLLHFQVFPIYPRFYSEDFIQHLRITKDVLKGSFNPLFATYPAGAHLLIGASFLSGSESLLGSASLTSGLLAFMTALLVYSTGYRITGRRSVGTFALLFYVLGGSLWFGMLFSSGLVPNFLTTVPALLLILLLAEDLESPGWIQKILILVTTISLYLSHYTAVFVIAAISIYSVVAPVFHRRPTKHLFIDIALVLAPAVGLFLSRPDLLYVLLSFRESSGGFVIAPEPTPLKLWLSQNYNFPYYLGVVLNSDLLLIFLLIAPFLAAFKAISRRYLRQPRLSESWALLFVTWFLLVWFFTPSTGVAARFSLAALSPGTFLFGYAAEAILLPLWTRKVSLGSQSHHRAKHIKPRGTAKWTIRAVIVGGIVMLTFYPSITYNMYASLPSYSELEPLAELYIRDASEWVKQNIPATRLVAVTDWRFSFLSLEGYEVVRFFGPPFPSQEEVRGLGSYAIVTAGRYPTKLKEGGVRIVDLVRLYDSLPHYRRIYNNEFVYVYRLTESK